METTFLGLRTAIYEVSDLGRAKETHGATDHSSVSDVGDGIKVGIVLDPFGNTFGVIENPHFKL